MKFVNDPQAADLVPVGAGVPVLVAFSFVVGKRMHSPPPTSSAMAPQGLSFGGGLFGVTQMLKVPW